MTHTALRLRLRFAGDIATEIRGATWDVLRDLAGASRALDRSTVARHVRARLGLHSMAPATVERRVREAVAALLEDGVRIVSCGRGLYLAETAEEIAEGDKALAANAFGALRRLASYRRTTLGELLRLLGQESLDLAPSGERPRDNPLNGRGNEPAGASPSTASGPPDRGGRAEMGHHAPPRGVQEGGTL